jgi:hypothetical protein
LFAEDSGRLRVDWKPKVVFADGSFELEEREKGFELP